MALNTFDYNKETAVNIVKTILADAIKNRATDIHLDPVADGLVIKMRIDGELIEYTKAPENMKKNILTRVKIISGMNITESETPQKGAINHEENNENYNMRVSTLPLLNGEKIVIHLSDYNKSLEGIDNLGISEADLNKIKTLMTNTSGIILITGQIISGKTTTMYSMLKELKDDSKNIITIENPIKMKIEGLNQAQVNNEKGLTIPALLETALLQDPNIIGLSEIADDETARMAIRSALNGKLIISTMPTKNIYTTLNNLGKRDIERYLLSTSLSGIISQRLVKKLCKYCSKERPATDYEKNIYKNALGMEIENIVDAVGCRECQDGYNGRIPVTEVLIIDDNIKNAINNHVEKEQLRNLVYQNNTNLIEDGLNKVLAGETTLDEVLKITDLTNDFGNYNDLLKRAILGEIEYDPTAYDNVTEETPVEEVPVENTEEVEQPIEVTEEVTTEEQVVEETPEDETEITEEAPIEESSSEEVANEETPAEETQNEEVATTEEPQVEEQSTEEITPTEETTTEEQPPVEENVEPTENTEEVPIEVPAEQPTEEDTTPVEPAPVEVPTEQPTEEDTTPVEPAPVEVPAEQPASEPAPVETPAVPQEEPVLEEDYDNLDYGDYQGI